MMVDEVASPFSIASMTAALAAWLFPTSSTLTIRILSPGLYPNRSASDVDDGLGGAALTITNAPSNRINTTLVFIVEAPLNLTTDVDARATLRGFIAESPNTQSLAELNNSSRINLCDILGARRLCGECHQSL